MERVEEIISVRAEACLLAYITMNGPSVDIETLRDLLRRGADVNFRGRFSKTPLCMYLSCQHPRPEVVQVLLEAGAFVDAPATGRMSAPNLYLANAAQPEAPLLRALLCGRTRGPSLCSPAVATSLLHGVMLRGRYSRSTEAVLEMLVAEFGADVNARIGDLSALHVCLAGISPASPDLVRTLLRLGADLRAIDERRMTPLGTLVKSAQCTVDMIRLLLEAGADLHALDFCGNTLLHLHAQSSRPRPAVVRALIAAGCDPRATNEFGNTAMHVLAMGSSCKRSLLAPFLESGMDINTPKASGGATCLHIAAGYANSVACRKLLRQGADPVRKTLSGRGPLVNMLTHEVTDALELALETNMPPAEEVAAALALAEEARPTPATRACVAYVVLRAGAEALHPRDRETHAALVESCLLERALLGTTVCATSRVTMLELLCRADTPAARPLRRASRVPANVVVYAPELRQKLSNLRRKSRLVSRLKNEVCPCPLPAEVVEDILLRLTVPELRACVGSRRLPLT